jgi:hypothetical protein
MNFNQRLVSKIIKGSSGQNFFAWVEIPNGNGKSEKIYPGKFGSNTFCSSKSAAPIDLLQLVSVNRRLRFYFYHLQEPIRGCVCTPAKCSYSAVTPVKLLQVAAI